MAAPQKIKRPRKFVWQRDVRLVIRPGMCRYSAIDTAQGNSVYVLSRIGPTCAIVPRGMLSHDHESFARYAYYLKGFIEDQCTENVMIFLVVLRGVYDILTAETVLFLKKTCRKIKLICAEVSDAYFLKLKSPLRDRYMSILQQADEVHTYNWNLRIGEAEAYALTNADILLLIITERKIHTWQRLIDTLWHDMHHTGDLLYNISQCHIVYMEWIMHMEMNEIII